MARTRKTSASDPAQTDIEQIIAQKKTPAERIRRVRQLEAWIDEQQEAFNSCVKSAREEIFAEKAALLEEANAQGVNSFATDDGTAYVSERLSAKIDPNAKPYTNASSEVVTGREAVLDFSLEHWEEFGAEHLQVGFGIDGVRTYIAKYNEPPPGISISTMRQINIRKS